ncbi:hypothetical protein BV898_15453 [Hypsibius exemplaris]|uniref:WAP domain-containing protein n=1 Tax=Hypsibius exemplaris TaxID=2072580 RepID=A0A9X6NB00_HYPEX|nr:hypothetical protein BV898_15453 [Hypsibius exemplaris]
MGPRMVFGLLLMASPLFLTCLSACCIVNKQVCGKSLPRRCWERLDHELDSNPNILYTCRKGVEPVVLKECSEGCEQDLQNPAGSMCAAEEISMTRMTTATATAATPRRIYTERKQVKTTPSSSGNSSRGQKKECASNQTFCKATQSCYYTATEECCAKGEQPCGKTCYNPKNSYCYEGGFVCRHGELPCGNGIGKAYECYNSSRSWCYQGGTVCPHGEQPCRGGKSCYNSTRSNCFSSGVVCDLGLNSCDGSACYNLSDSWCYTGGVVCPHAESPCGRSCYAEDRFWCFEGGIICPHGQQPCGRICYDSKIFICRAGKVEAKSNGEIN